MPLNIEILKQFYSKINEKIKRNNFKIKIEKEKRVNQFNN